MNQFLNRIIFLSLLFFLHNRANEASVLLGSKNIIDETTQTIRNDLVNNFIEWKEYPLNNSLNKKNHATNNRIYNYCRSSSKALALCSGVIVQLFNAIPHIINEKRNQQEKMLSFPLEMFSIIMQYVGYISSAQTVNFLNQTVKFWGCTS